jgi:hypothetical protein
VAERGTSKERSERHESFVAAAYKGRRSPSSGAAVHDPGDVRTPHQLIECKTTGGPEKPSTLPVFVQHLEKVCLEAWEEGREGAVALRYYAPTSKLANLDGFVNVVVRQLLADVDLCHHQ